MIEKKIIFQYTADESGGKMDASYIHLKESLRNVTPGESVQQMIVDGKTIEGGENFRGELIVDLDKKGNIIGIEILGNVIPDSLKA